MPGQSGRLSRFKSRKLVVKRVALAGPNGRDDGVLFGGLRPWEAPVLELDAD